MYVKREDTLQIVTWEGERWRKRKKKKGDGRERLESNGERGKYRNSIRKIKEEYELINE